MLSGLVSVFDTQGRFLGHSPPPWSFPAALLPRAAPFETEPLNSRTDARAAREIELDRQAVLGQAWVSQATVGMLWDVSVRTVQSWEAEKDPRLPPPVVQEHKMTRYLLGDVLRLREQWRASRNK